MKLGLIRYVCLSGFVSVTLSVLQPPSSVHFILNALTWPDAQTYCRTTYTDLARIKDNNTLKMMTDIAQGYGIFTWCLWIGLFNDFNSWRWSFNETIRFTNTNLLLFSNWLAGQPDNYYVFELCAEIDSSGFWNDVKCTDLKPSICYDAGKSGADRFVGVSTLMTWSEAQTYCRTSHTDLASAVSQSDNNLLAQVASVQGISWFGLYRDSWKWSNRTVVSNLAWNPGQPAISGFNTCGCLRNGLAGDEPCEYGHYFFCESIPPVERQIVKLQVKSDGSVFDPAVQLAILQKIYGIIARHGMLQNTTVTWRMQPAGNIFYKNDVN